MKNNEFGRSMIEMLSVLAIVGILSVGSISGYTNAMLKYRVNKLSYQTLEIIVNIRNLYLREKSYSGIDLDLLSKLGVIPSDMYKRPGFVSQIFNAFNGNVKVFESKNGDDRILAFEVYNTNITTKGCIALATQDWGTDPTSGFTGLFIGSGDVTAPMMENIILGSPSNMNEGIFTVGIHEHNIPLDVAEATLACNCGPGDCVVGIKYR